jgi:DNA-binding NtrC family response regulator
MVQKRQQKTRENRHHALKTKNRSLKIDKNKLKKSRVLIIQEEDITGELLSQLLIDKGCQVDTTTSAIEGLMKMKRKKYHLVITDSRILDPDSSRFIGQSRVLNKKSALVVIAAGDTDNGARYINDASIDLVIPTPMDVNTVIKNILNVLIVGNK